MQKCLIALKPYEGEEDPGSYLVAIDADTVHSTIQNWLRQLNDDDLDTVPEMEAHMAAYPAYHHPGFRAVIADLLGQPIWRLLSRPCSRHQCEHLGELNLLKQILRGKVG